MATKTPAKKKPVAKAKVRAKLAKPASKPKRAPVVVLEKPIISMAVSPLAAKPKESAKEREDRERRRQVLHQMLMRKRQEIIKEIEGSLANPSLKINSGGLNLHATSAIKPSWISIASWAFP